MRYNLDIYRDGEKVNTMTSADECAAYKELAKVLYSINTKRATRTSCKKNGDALTVKQFFGREKTQLISTYTYIYTFQGVEL